MNLEELSEQISLYIANVKTIEELTLKLHESQESKRIMLKSSFVGFYEQLAPIIDQITNLQKTDIDLNLDNDIRCEIYRNSNHGGITLCLRYLSKGQEPITLVYCNQELCNIVMPDSSCEEEVFIKLLHSYNQLQEEIKSKLLALYREKNFFNAEWIKRLQANLDDLN